jgi:CHASE2 domain-containing sensor protein
MTHHIPDGLIHEVWQLYEGGHSSDEILSRLLKRNVNMDVAEAVLSKVKLMQDARKRRRGLRLVIAGGIVLVSAFLITFLLHVAGFDTNIPLYGLTTIGIGMLFTGMIFYMG